MVGDGNTVIANDIALNTLQSKKINEGNFYIYIHSIINVITKYYVVIADGSKKMYLFVLF